MDDVLQHRNDPSAAGRYTEARVQTTHGTTRRTYHIEVLTKLLKVKYNWFKEYSLHIPIKCYGIGGCTSSTSPTILPEVVASLQLLQVSKR